MSRRAKMIAHRDDLDQRLQDCETSQCVDSLVPQLCQAHFALYEFDLTQQRRVINKLIDAVDKPDTPRFINLQIRYHIALAARNEDKIAVEQHELVIDMLRRKLKEVKK